MTSSLLWLPTKPISKLRHWTAKGAGPLDGRQVNWNRLLGGASGTKRKASVRILKDRRLVGYIALLIVRPEKRASFIGATHVNWSEAMWHSSDVNRLDEFWTELLTRKFSSQISGLLEYGDEDVRQFREHADSFDLLTPDYAVTDYVSRLVSRWGGSGTLQSYVRKKRKFSIVEKELSLTCLHIVYNTQSIMRNGASKCIRWVRNA